MTEGLNYPLFFVGDIGIRKGENYEYHDVILQYEETRP